MEKLNRFQICSCKNNNFLRENFSLHHFCSLACIFCDHLSAALKIIAVSFASSLLALCLQILRLSNLSESKAKKR